MSRDADFDRMTEHRVAECVGEKRGQKRGGIGGVAGTNLA
jgi:hypothetical protein